MNRYSSLKKLFQEGLMMRVGLFAIFILLIGCAGDRKFADFANEDSGKGEQEFLKESKQCIADKDKFLSLIHI